MNRQSITANKTSALDAKFGFETHQPWMAKLPIFLRSFGALAVIFSLYSFLFRGWEGSGDLLRYLMLLGHTGLLAVIALASGHYFREGKGPRLLFMLALVSVPVNFAILGGFIFAGVNTVFPGDYPSFVTWSVGNLNTALMLAAGAATVLLGVVVLGFRTLARGMSKRMTVLFMLSNLALLLPIRDPVWVSLLTFGLGLYTLLISTKTARQRTEVKTFEGMIAILLQFLPMGILLGRNIWLYTPDLFMFSVMAIIVFIGLRHCSQFLAKESPWRVLMELFSQVVALVAGISVGAALFDYQHSLSIAMVAGGVVTALMSNELARRAAYFNTFYQFVAMFSVCSASLLNLLWVHTLTASIVGIGIGVAMIGLGYRNKQKSLFTSGSIVGLAATTHLFYFAIQYFDVNYWLAFAIMGVLAIVGASVLESRGGQIRERLQKYRLDYADWHY